MSIGLAMGTWEHPAHLDRVSVCVHGPGVPYDSRVQRESIVPRDCKYSKQHGECHFAHELLEVRAPGRDPGGRPYEQPIFEKRISMYFGQQYTWKHRAAIEAWALGVSDEYLPQWYHMLRWQEEGWENTETSLELYGADFGHEQRKVDFERQTRQSLPIWDQELHAKLGTRWRDWTAYRGMGWTGESVALLFDEFENRAKALEPVCPTEVDEESEPEARGSAKRRRGGPLWYMEHEDHEYEKEWASRLAHARSRDYPWLTIDERILGRLEETNKGEYGHGIKFLKYKELLHMTEHVQPEAWRAQEYEFLRALFVAPTGQGAGLLRSEYIVPVEYDRDWKEAHEIGDVMGELLPDRGVARYIVARRDVFSRPWSESLLRSYAHGTGGLGFLAIWRDLQVLGAEAHDGHVYAYPSMDSVHDKQYAWFEHFGAGLWARFTVLLQGPFQKSGSATPQQWNAQGPLVPAAFVIDVAPTYAVLQMALRRCIPLVDFCV